MNPDRYVAVGQDVYIDKWGSGQYYSTRQIIGGLFGGGLLLVMAAAILFPLFARGHDRRRSHCQNSLKQIGLALAQYTQDNDETYPLTHVNDTGYTTRPPYGQPYGWADALYPYLKTVELFHCDWASARSILHPTASPTAGGSDPGAVGFTDYWLNGNFNGTFLGDVATPAQCLMLGDGNNGLDANTARYNLRQLPLAWRSDANSPARRHLDGANYAYADGHVKWLPPTRINVRPHVRDTFAVW